MQRALAGGDAAAEFAERREALEDVVAVLGDPIIDQRELAVVPHRRVGVVGGCQVPQVGLGHRLPRGLSGSIDRGQQDADERGDDREHDKELDDRECVSPESTHGVWSSS